MMTGESSHRFRRRAVKRAKTMKRARSASGRFWAGLGLVGSVGWMIALPTIAGAFLGRVLDERWNTDLSFTLGLLMLGLFVGGYSVWRLFIRRPP